MTKKIDTLVTDIYDVIKGKGGWEGMPEEYFKERVHDTMTRRLATEREERDPTLRMSNLGTTCDRKLWYYINSKYTGHTGEEMPAAALFKFMYGDIIEDLTLSLAKAAGHSVEGEQDEMYVNGVKGHRDAVIDGMLIDVKSASPYAFKKFQSNGLREEGADSFGYITQLAAYLKASQDDPCVLEKNRAGFLVVDKSNGHICLDIYDLTPEMETIEDEVERKRTLINATSVPPRGFSDEPFRKSGNRKIPTVPCSYCEYKKTCWPGLRTFVDYSGRPTHLSVVKSEPKMKEIT